MRVISGESSRTRNERELRLGYFSHVFADFHRLARTDREALLADLPASLQKLMRSVDDAGEVPDADQMQLDWGEIATLEDKILALQDEATLRRRTWQTRARYALLVGAANYQTYLGSHPPDESDLKVPADALRADLRRLLGTTHFSYSLAIVRENNRRRVMWKVTAWTATLCLLALAAAGYLLGFSDGPLAGTICAVVLFGCLGAYISVQRRLQETPDAGDPVIGILGLYEFNSIQPFPVIAGGVFAVVLYFILAAQFMIGTLFPTLGPGGVPVAMGDWAKLFIWSLLAGFAERLVPDTLDRLTSQARLKGESSSVVIRSATTRTLEGGADATARDAANDNRDLVGKDAGRASATDRARETVMAAAREAAEEAAKEAKEAKEAQEAKEATAKVDQSQEIASPGDIKAGPDEAAVTEPTGSQPKKTPAPAGAEDESNKPAEV